MAAKVVLNGEPRTETGKGAARRLRREDRIPAVVYGHTDPLHCSISGRDFYKTFHTVSESTIVTLAVGNDKRDVLIKDYDEDIRTGIVWHIDFFEVELGKKLRTNIALEFTGSPKGTREGGVLEHHLYQIEIECLPKDIPEHLAVDVSDLGIDDSLHVSDLVIPEGVKVLTNEDQTVASIVIPRAVVEDEDEEAAEGTEPEVIGEKSEDDEASE